MAPALLDRSSGPFFNGVLWKPCFPLGAGTAKHSTRDPVIPDRGCQRPTNHGQVTQQPLRPRKRAPPSPCQKRTNCTDGQTERGSQSDTAVTAGAGPYCAGFLCRIREKAKNTSAPAYQIPPHLILWLREMQISASPRSERTAGYCGIARMNCRPAGFILCVGDRLDSFRQLGSRADVAIRLAGPPVTHTISMAALWIRAVTGRNASRLLEVSEETRGHC